MADKLFDALMLFGMNMICLCLIGVAIAPIINPAGFVRIPEWLPYFMTTIALVFTVLMNAFMISIIKED